MRDVDAAAAKIRAAVPEATISRDDFEFSLSAVVKDVAVIVFDASNGSYTPVEDAITRLTEAAGMRPH